MVKLTPIETSVALTRRADAAMSPEEIMEIIKSATATEREVVRATTQLVLAAVKAAGALSIMPAAHLPKAGLLLMVHPDVYEQVRASTRSAEVSGNA